ncbi:hypothetical protein [Flavisphingomonas formosensis]|uniref:hypothetical protein n=1 Tax=Flavisphingomonas formosensis TaxID=861534 RepID=UPI0012FA5281|nr:hypothetical protein [Sphingomonas formosensis]
MLRIFVVPALASALLIPAMASAHGQAGDAPASAPAVAPPGANIPFQPVPGARIVIDPSAEAAVFAPQPATQNYPACSAHVTDRCTEPHSRG